MRELARFIPDCLTAIGRLRGDPRVPRRAKAARQVARQVLLDAWPGDPRLLERLLGPAPHPA